MKNLSILLLLIVCLASCKKELDKNTISPEEKAKNERIREHFIPVVGELDKFMNAKSLNTGYKFEENYTTSLPYAIFHIQQMKSVGFTEYSHTDYKNAFSYALTHAIKNEEAWKKLTYTLAAKKYGNITNYNTTKQKNVDSLAYFQTGTNIISNAIYANGVEIQGFAELQQILEKTNISDKLRTPIDILN